MIKRFIAIFISILIFMTGVSVYASENSALVYEAFDNYALNSVPETMISDGVDARVVTRKGLDKAFGGKAWGGEDFLLSLPIEGANDKMVLSADVMVSGERTDGTILSAKGTSTTDLIKYEKSGKIRLYDGKILGGYLLGEWKNFCAVVDFTAARLDLYIDEKKVLDNHLFAMSARKIPSAIEFYFSAPSENSSNILIDNVLVYNGKTVLPKSSFTGKGISSETEEYVETLQKPENGILYMYNNFENDADTTFTPNGNTVEFFRESKNNTVLRICRDQNDKNASAGFVFPAEMLELDKYAVSFDIFVKKNEGAISMMEIINHSGELLGSVSITNGSFYLAGRTVTSISTNKWYNITIMYNNVRKTYSAYVNGVLKYENAPTGKGAMQPHRARTRVEGSGVVEYYFDNVLAWSGNDLISFSQEELVDASKSEANLEDEDDAKDIIGAAKVFMTEKDAVFIEETKKSYLNYGSAPYKKDSIFMVPTALLEKAFGFKIENIGGKILVDGIEKASVGSTKLKSGATLEASPEILNEVLFVPLESFCKNVLSLYVCYDERCMYMIGPEPIEYTNSSLAKKSDEPIDVVHRYMQFQRPDGEEMFQRLLEYTPKNQHPRLITNKQDLEKVKTLIDTDADFNINFDNVLKIANTYLSRGVVEFTTAEHATLLNKARSIMDRIRTLGVAYVISGDSIYAERAWREMENCALNWPTWNGDGINQLECAETSYGLAMGYDFIYDWMSEEQKQIIIDALFEKALEHFDRSYRGRAQRVDWVTAIHNWNAVINGGGVVAPIIAIIDDLDGERLEFAKRLLGWAVRSVEHSICGMWPDGGWNEGTMYWEYAMMYMYGGVFSPLYHALGTTYDLLDMRGIKDSLNTIMALQSPNGTNFNFGQSHEIQVKDSIGFLMAKIQNDDALMATWKSVRDTFKMTGDARQLLWYKPTENSTKNAMLLDNYFTSNHVGVMKGSNTNADAAYIGIKAGTNGTVDNHLDLGNFVFDTLGRRWAIELGVDDYDMKSADYFIDRPLIYRCRPEGQNCMVINPRADIPEMKYYGGQVVGTEAVLKDFVSKTRGAYMTVDLSEPYKMDTSKYMRGFYFGDDRQTLLVQDELTLLEADSEMLWFMHTRAEIEISADGKSAILSLDDKQIKVEAVSNATSFHFENRKVEPLPTSPYLYDQLKGSYEPVGISKLTLVAKGSGDINISVKLSPVIEYENFEAPKYIPMNEWQVPDGEMPQKLRAKAIYANGKLIDGFESDKIHYSINVPYGSDVAQIAAEPTTGTMEIVQAQKVNEAAKVIITGKDGKVIVYDIMMLPIAREVDDIIKDLKPVVGIPEGYAFADRVSAEVSVVQQSENNEAMLIDNDLSTRWAVEGYDQWAVIDLGRVYDLSGVALGVYEGSKRSNIFNLLVSEDGLVYYKVFDGLTSGLTSDNYESYIFPQTRKVRYIKYVGNQNNKNTWNSVTEIAGLVKE